MDFHVEEMPMQRAAYMRNLGPYSLGGRELMERLKAWAAVNGLFQASAVILGIAWDNPAFTPSEKCRYDVCIAVKEGFALPDDSVREAILPGGRYVVFTLAHTAQAIGEAWGAIFPELAARGYKADPVRPILERYVPYMVEKHLCEICVPVTE